MLDGGVTLDWRLDPLDLLRRWPADRSVYLLHSGRLDPRWSRVSAIAEPTEALRHQYGQTRWNASDSELAQSIALTHDPLQDMRNVLRADDGRSLWLGYLGYDLGRAIEQLPNPAPDDRGWPDFQLERCRGWLAFDHRSERWTAHGCYADQPPPLEPDHAPPHRYTAGPIDPEQSAEEIQQHVRRVIDYIAGGDVFQVNLAQRFTGPFDGSPRGLYAELARRSPAWYGAYGELTPFDDDEPKRSLASISPELFLDCDASGRVITRPIKGTRPSSSPVAELEDSDKDCAELAMIVDLMRNDLGRVCRYGSIAVDQRRAIESHPTVHHGVATISGELRGQCDLVDLLRATMPGGSITGAPKVRAMQIIDELEPARRGPYCGAIGMIRGRSARLNIAIRTVLIEQATRGASGRADVWAGGGIVADSDPVAEYHEMLDKARAMRDALCHRSAATSGQAQKPLQTAQLRNLT